MINEVCCLSLSVYASHPLTLCVHAPSQVTWMYVPEPNQDPVNIAVFLPGNEPSYPASPVKGRVSFVPSSPNVASPSIQITDVKMTDEGKYACEFATYPGGNVRGTTQLVMLGRSHMLSL